MATSGRALLRMGRFIARPLSAGGNLARLSATEIVTRSVHGTARKHLPGLCVIFFERE